MAFKEIKTWRVVATSNYDEDDYCERFVAIDIAYVKDAQGLAKLMNKSAGEGSKDYYVVQPHTEIRYVLRTGVYG